MGHAGAEPTSTPGTHHAHARASAWRTPSAGVLNQQRPAWPTPAKSWEAVASQFPPPALLWAAEAEICMASNGRLKDAPFRPAFGSESPRSSRTTHVTPGPGAYYTPARIGSSQFRQPLPRAAPAVSSTPMRLRAHSAGRARMPASPRPGSAARCSESRDTAWRPGPPPNSRKSRAVRGARAATPARVGRGTHPRVSA